MAPVTGPEIMTAAGFILFVLGTVWGAWRYVESKIEKVRTASQETADKVRAESGRQIDAAVAHARLVQAQLAEHKLHVAETYVTKQGLREYTDPIMEAISGVRASIDRLSTRVDQKFDRENGR